MNIINKMKSLIVILLSFMVVIACSNNKANRTEETNIPETSDVKRQGIIVDKQIVNTQSYRVLMVTGITTDELNNQSIEEILNKAMQEMNVAWYVVDQETYGKLKPRQKVEITSGNKQKDSNPPIRDAKRVEIKATY
ncbi:PBP1b-binding outer membrane lipoprotein LpoB [Paenibacillus sp. V4I9]|uniref:DUF3221 domain-containing protein n=1 Tax=Paenibacillus sp. V4I9 TaxID=3042308 RepID=UPI00277FB44C|nr:DUF3221 domain-containing protein [Paenibacillus sp. V4I9]MDQ0888593.1 PBP1b-binding outer membrane lipoprotein LpoB [Paenibacillus sp. V4I9]